MTRPEGVLLFGVSVGFKILEAGTRVWAQRRRSYARQSMAREAGRFGQWLGGFAILYVPYFAWRYAAYDWFFPNTYYAKVGSGIDQYERGVQYLKPLTLREVAEVIDMHESTVSRVTNEKFVQTPRGVLPLKFFFSSGLSTTSGEEVSARGIKAQIQKLVSEENPARPLTDQAIVNILKEEGIQIARRTVAKYRDQLGILSARMRKRV